MTEAQLRAFVAVAESGSFGEAARRLHMSQPGVSRAVSALERELGGALFERPGAELTALGERSLSRARTILAEADALRQEHADERGEVRGHVRLGSMPSVSALFSPLLAKLARRHPELSVAIIEGHDDELVQWVRDGVVDVAVVAGEPAGLELQPLLVDALLAVVPAAHPLAAGPVARSAFAGEPFILTRAGCERIVLDTLAAAGVVPDVRYEVTEASSILAMVGEGLGLSIMPRLAAAAPPATVALLELDPPGERRLALATARRSPAVRAFLQAAAMLRGPGPT